MMDLLHDDYIFDNLGKMMIDIFLKLLLNNLICEDYFSAISILIALHSKFKLYLYKHDIM